MPIRTHCPSCKALLGVPEGPARQRVRCPYCATIFVIADQSATQPLVTPPRPPTQPAKPQRIPAPRTPTVKASAPPSLKKSRIQNILRKAKNMPIAWLIGIGAGLGGMFLLLIGSIALWLVLRSSPAGGEPLAQETAQQMAQGSKVVSEAPPVAEENEEFVDLPERDEVIQAVGGLNPDPKPGEGEPGARPKVAITSVRAMRLGGRPGVYFEIGYHFEQGAPAQGARYGWVIVTKRRGVFKLALAAGALHERGTLKGHLKFVTNNLDAPFRTYLIIETPGGQGMREEKISNEMTIQ